MSTTQPDAARESCSTENVVLRCRPVLAGRPGIASGREIGTLVDRVSAECEMDGDEMLVKSLVLFREVFRAYKEGLRVAFLDGDDEIVEEIDGIDAPILRGRPIQAED